MDYPQDPSVGLVDGKFVDENEVAAQIGSVIPSSWSNAITDEIMNVQEAAGIEADENAHDQLLKALRVLYAKVNGDPTEAFSVAAATESADAVQLGQLVASLAANGYVKIPVISTDGVKKTLIIQWVKSAATAVPANTDNAISASWPITFPNGLLMSQAAVATTSSAGTVSRACDNGLSTSSTASANVYNGPTAQNVALSWIGIGLANS